MIPIVKLEERTNVASIDYSAEPTGNSLAASFSPSNQSNAPLGRSISARRTAEAIVAHARHEHRGRVWGLRLNEMGIVSKESTEDWSRYTVSAGHILGKLDLNPPSAAQLHEGGTGFRRAAVSSIAQELTGRRVTVRATREDKQPPRGREYRRVELQFVSEAEQE